MTGICLTLVLTSRPTVIHNVQSTDGGGSDLYRVLPLALRVPLILRPGPETNDLKRDVSRSVHPVNDIIDIGAYTRTAPSGKDLSAKCRT